MNATAIADETLKWAERLERIRGSQARCELAGMTRPPRDPAERALLMEFGGQGPFAEALPEVRAR